MGPRDHQVADASRPGGGLTHRPTALSDVDRFGFTLRNCSHCLTSQSGLSPWTMTRASQPIRLSTKASRTFSGLQQRAGRMLATPFLQSSLAIWTASAWSFSSALTKTSLSDSTSAPRRGRRRELVDSSHRQPDKLAQVRRHNGLPGQELQVRP